MIYLKAIWAALVILAIDFWADPLPYFATIVVLALISPMALLASALCYYGMVYLQTIDDLRIYNAMMNASSIPTDAWVGKAREAKRKGGSK